MSNIETPNRDAAEKADAPRAGISPVVLALSGVIVLLIGIIVGLFAAGRASEAPVAQAAPEAQAVQPGPIAPPNVAPHAEPNEEREALLASQSGYVFGSDDAPVTVYELIDFQCPACASVALSFLPSFKQEYVESGEVKLVLLDFPLNIHRYAFHSSMAARCAQEQDGFAAYHDRLFERQVQWANSTDPKDIFVSLAEESGLDADRFRTCYEEDRYGDVIMENNKVAIELGAPGTPTFYVRGARTENGAQGLLDAIERALAASAD